MLRRREWELFPAVKLLLSARADVNLRDAFGGNSLCWTALANNGVAVRLLLEARCDVDLDFAVGFSPFQLACIKGSVACMKEMLAQMPLSLRFSLHYCCLLSGDRSTVSLLLEAKADLDERFKLSVQEKRTLWLAWTLLSWTHRVRPSRLTWLAYHSDNATPLMFSILAGRLEATSVLLAAGAQVDLRNSRGKTAAEFLAAPRAVSAIPSQLFFEESEDEESEEMVSESF